MASILAQRDPAKAAEAMFYTFADHEPVDERPKASMDDLVAPWLKSDAPEDGGAPDEGKDAEPPTDVLSLVSGYRHERSTTDE